jgi:beta-lactamase regulating signal transducer with metallopeptidase domain
MAEFLEGLLVSSVSGAIIAALFFLVKPFVKNKISHNGQYFSWYLVFVRMLLPYSLGGIFIGNLLAFPQNQPMQSSVTLAASGNPSATTSAAISSVQTVGQQQTSIFVQAAHNGGLFMNNWSSLLFILWLLGLIVMFGINMVVYIGYGRRIHSSRKQIDDIEILALLKECSGKLKLARLLPVYVSPCTDTPMLCGLFRCAIVLPDRSFTPEQFRHAFMHELVHYRRHDNLLKWLAVLAVSANWFNPVIYFAAREAGRQCELACDEAVTVSFSRDERISYGKTLLAVASKSDHRPFTLSATMGEDKRNLKERLEVLARGKGGGRKTVFFTVALFSIAAIITTVTLMVSCAKTPSSSASKNSVNSSSSVETGSKKTDNSSSSVDITDSTIDSSTDPDVAPQIINTISDDWKARYSDIIISNEWISAKVEEDIRYITLAGALKSDPRQGVVEVVTTNRDGTAVKSDQRFICPSKSGALTVAAIGAKDTTMTLHDADGHSWNFHIFNGFDPQTPVD